MPGFLSLVLDSLSCSFVSLFLKGSQRCICRFFGESCCKGLKSKHRVNMNKWRSIMGTLQSTYSLVYLLSSKKDSPPRNLGPTIIHLPRTYHQIINSTLVISAYRNHLSHHLAFTHLFIHNTLIHCLVPQRASIYIRCLLLKKITYIH